MVPLAVYNVIAALLIAKVTSQKEPGVCGKLCEGGVYDLCVKCPTPCPTTCDNRNGPPRPCPAYCLANGCECAEGYVRDANQQCILPSQCPAKIDVSCPNCDGPNKQCSHCYSSCRQTCKNILNPLEPTEPCLISCGGKFCTCMDNYYLADDGECVLKEDCLFHSNPIEPPVLPPPIICDEPCTGGEHDNCVSCGTPCPLTCDNLGSSQSCPAHCVPNVCRCDDGYARTSDGRCVLPEKCPAKTNLCRAKYTIQ